MKHFCGGLVSEKEGEQKRAHILHVIYELLSIVHSDKFNYYYYSFFCFRVQTQIERRRKLSVRLVREPIRRRNRWPITVRVCRWPIVALQDAEQDVRRLPTNEHALQPGSVCQHILRCSPRRLLTSIAQS